MNAHGDLLKTYIENRSIISIKREKIDNNTILSTPLKVSTDFLLLAYLYDFFLNGYKIVKIEDITQLKQSDSEKHIEEICNKERILEFRQNFDSLSLTNWQSIFRWISYTDQIVTIESEKLNGSEFYIGSIIVVESDSLAILQFDGAGIWDKDRSIIKYDSISCITFGDMYSSLMGKYAKAESH